MRLSLRKFAAWGSGIWSQPRALAAPIASEVSRRIAIARYLSIVGILIVHNDYKPIWEMGDSAFELTKTFLVHGLFRYALPLLTAISGWLLFTAALDQRYGKLIANKTRTLLVPLIIWNLPLVLAIYLLQRYDLIWQSLGLKFYPFELTHWLNGVLSIFHAPVDYPLYFLRDLFVLALLSPIFGFVIRRLPYWGLAVILVIFALDLDGVLVLHDHLMVTFYIGGLAAVRKWDLKRLDKYAVPLLISLLACSVFIAIAKIENIDWLRVLAPFWLWPCFSLIEKSRYADVLVRWSKTSFYLFVTHGPLLTVLWKLYEVYEPISGRVPYGLYWVMAAIFAVAFGHLTLRPFQAIAPGLARLALGNRVAGEDKRPSFLENPMPNLKGKLHFGSLLPSRWDHVPVGIEQVDLRGPLLHVNRKLCEMLGYTREELEQLSFRDITHPVDLRNEEKYLSRLISGKIRSYSIEKRYLHKDGHAVPVRVTSSQVNGSASGGGYRISIIEDCSGAAATDAATISLESSRGSRFAALKRVLPDRLQELNETIHSAIAECLAYRERAPSHDRSSS